MGRFSILKTSLPQYISVFSSWWTVMYCGSDILTIVAVAIFCKGYTDHLVAFRCTFGELLFSILHRLKCKLYLALCPIQYNRLLSKNWSGWVNGYYPIDCDDFQWTSCAKNNSGCFEWLYLFTVSPVSPEERRRSQVCQLGLTPGPSSPPQAPHKPPRTPTHLSPLALAPLSCLSSAALSGSPPPPLCACLGTGALLSSSTLPCHYCRWGASCTFYPVLSPGSTFRLLT